MPSDSPSRVTVYAVMIVLGLLGAISDAVLNKWAKTDKLGWLLAAYASWLAVATLLGMVLRWDYFSFGTAVVLFLLVNTLGAVVLDSWLYSNRLNVWGWIGIFLASGAIVSLELGRSQPRSAATIETKNSTSTE